MRVSGVRRKPLSLSPEAEHCSKVTKARASTRHTAREPNTRNMNFSGDETYLPVNRVPETPF